MGIRATLNINQDEKCPRCGRGGAVNGGLCLDCATKRLGGLMEFKGVNVTASSVDLVKGKGKVGFEINMEDLLDQRDRLREWADQEVPLVITIEPMQRPLEGFDRPSRGAERPPRESIGQRQIPTG